MYKLGPVDIVLEGMTYFGIQAPFLKPYNLAHFINKIFDIELAKTTDFESYATGKRVDFHGYTYVSETEKIAYYFIGNKNSNVLFSNFSDMNFWFLVQFQDEFNEERLASLKEKMYNELSQLEQVFLVVETDLERLAKYECFLEDFSYYCTQLLQKPV